MTVEARGMMYSASYKRYVVGLLLVVYICNYVDRQILALLMEPIRREFRLSDTQLGFLSGPAFVLFYATMGIPIARYADRKNRVTIISVSIAIWSGMVMLSGVAGSFWHLLLARVGVGIGEAGCTPSAQSLISDYCSPTERTRALSIYLLGLPLGVLVSYLLGGWINQAFGWRMAFMAVGFPGLILAGLVKRTIQEPPRYRSDNTVAVTKNRVPIGVVFATLWRRKALRHLTIAFAIVGTVAASTLAWLPAFFIRSHGMATGELGTWLAPVTGIGGGVGIWLGGFLATRYGAHDARIQVRLLALSALLVAPMLEVALLWPGKHMALLLFLPANLLMFFSLAPLYSLVQGLCDIRMRATMVAVVMFIQLLFGGGVGGQLVGVLSDALTSIAHGGALRWAMVMTSLAAPWASVHFWLAGRSIKQDLIEASSEVVPTYA
jgi:predicted MFS family arabinose efflux permease